MIKKSFFLLLIVQLSGLCFAKGVTEKQAGLFEVAGVKIGMSEGQAIKALASKYQVPENKINAHKSFQKKMHGKTETDYLHLQTDNDADIYVYFEDDISVTPYKLVVSSVSYSIPNTPQNTKALYESAVKRYGKESLVSSQPDNFVWCPLKGTQSFTDNCKEGSTVLTVGRFRHTISLTNNKYTKARFKQEQDKKNRKPDF